MAEENNLAASDAADQNLDLPAEMFRSEGNPEETVMQIFRLRNNIGLINRKVKFTEIDGQAIFEGDIDLGSAEEAREEDSASRGIGITGPEFRWPSNIIPYVTQEALRTRVEAAIAEWQRHTPFRFVKRTNQPDFISFEDRGGCFSRVGRVPGGQVISLAPGCSIGSAIHEIGHALGLWHEQSREDRDNHVEIIEANIDADAKFNFDKHILDGDDLGEYDFNSIMHYPATAFSKNGLPTIRARGGQPIGQRNGLSRGDIAAIRMLYPNLDWPQQDPDILA